MRLASLESMRQLGRGRTPARQKHDDCALPPATPRTLVPMAPKASTSKLDGEKKSSQRPSWSCACPLVARPRAPARRSFAGKDRADLGVRWAGTACTKKKIK